MRRETLSIQSEDAIHLFQNNNQINTVLLIEDDEIIYTNTRELLELEGYKVMVATDGITGIALAKSRKPDIILCDIIMPGATGYEVIKELKKDSETCGIPFVFFTASVEKKEIKHAYTLGAAGYLEKPFEEKELFETIERCLNGSKILL